METRQQGEREKHGRMGLLLLLVFRVRRASSESAVLSRSAIAAYSAAFENMFKRTQPGFHVASSGLSEVCLRLH